MKLVIGLGNPGADYLNTRHNIGFLILEHWASRHKLEFHRGRTYDYLHWKNQMVIKPQTYMNRSGDALREILKRHRNLEDILIIVDDIYLPFAELRIRERGGDGGHNGLKSIIDVLQHDEFKRIRVGIQEPENGNLSDYVLSRFSQAETEQLQGVYQLTTKLLDLFLVQGYQAMTNFYSVFKKTYSDQQVRIKSPKEE